MPAVFLSVASGCKSPDPESVARPLTGIPDTFLSSPTLPEDPVIYDGWVHHLEDPTLESFLASGLAENFDLRIALARLDASAARFGIAASASNPSLNLSSGAARQRTNLETPAGLVSDTANRFDVVANVSWEIDLWGRLRASSAAARADFEASELDYQAALLSFSKNLVESWYGVVSNRIQSQIVSETLESLNQTLEIVEGRYQRGLTTSLDVRSSRSEVAAAGALQVSTFNEGKVLERRLQTLAGIFDSPLPTLPEVLPRLPPLPSPGVASKLLEQRPDLQAASFRLEAAARRVESAEKARLPNLQLTADLGRAAQSLEDLGNADFSVWGIAGRALLPITQGGLLKARVAESEALLRAEAETYRSLALQAFTEVEIALLSDREIGNQLTFLEQAVVEGVAAQTLALEQYERGITNITTVLSTQRRTLDAKRNLAAAQFAFLQNRLNFYLALGAYPQSRL
ncbi:MAG: efflux transporter outer membrane subunit [Puniceicoccaceae bacterium]